MRRYVCLYFPNWSTELATREHRLKTQNCPVLLTVNHSNQTIIKAFSSEAKKAGIEENITLALAKALLPAAVAYPYQPAHDFKLLYKLAVWCIRFTPLVAIDKVLIKAYKDDRLEHASSQHNTLILDIAGTEKIHNNENALLQRIFSRLNKAGITTQAGIASTIGCAWALSHYGERCRDQSASHFSQQNCSAWIASPGKKPLEAALKNLPVAALRTDKDSTLAIEELGIKNIHELKQLPQKQLLQRFGAKLINRIDQAYGLAEESLFLIHPRQQINVRREFDPPLRIRKAVEQALFSLLMELYERLSSQGRRAARFVLILQGFDPHKSVEDAPFLIRKEFALHAATRNMAHISSIIHPFFEKLKIPEGVCQISLAAEDAQNSAPEQGDCFSSSLARVSNSLKEEFLNSLIFQLGKTQVKKVVLKDSYVPEKSFAFLPLEQQEERETPALHGNLRYPPRLFDRPEQISTISLLPDSPPTRITWNGARYQITNGFGPERISSEWWQQKLEDVPDEREYFRLQDHTGRWLWVFRQRQSMEWFVHGVWA